MLLYWVLSWRMIFPSLFSINHGQISFPSWWESPLKSNSKPPFSKYPDSCFLLECWGPHTREQPISSSIQYSHVLCTWDNACFFTAHVFLLRPRDPWGEGCVPAPFWFPQSHSGTGIDNKLSKKTYLKSRNHFANIKLGKMQIETHFEWDFVIRSMNVPSVLSDLVQLMFPTNSKSVKFCYILCM